MRRIAVLCPLLLAAAAAPASAAVTVGQLSPGGTATCADDREFVPLSVSYGNQYRVPGNGRITSWSTNGLAAPNQFLALKVYNRVADPDVYSVVGHDGPRPLSAAGGTQAFSASIPVRSGDFIGLSTPPGAGTPGCAFSAVGDSFRFFTGNLADGGTGNFSGVIPDFRLNVAAVFEASNTFTVGRTTRDKKKGTATVEVQVPNAGELTATGKGVKASRAGARRAVAVSAPGTVKLTIRATGKKRKNLNSKGKAKLSVALTYTPTNGTAATQSLQVKLRKQRRG